MNTTPIKNTLYALMILMSTVALSMRGAEAEQKEKAAQTLSKKEVYAAVDAIKPETKNAIKAFNKNPTDSFGDNNEANKALDKIHRALNVALDEFDVPKIKELVDFGLVAQLTLDLEVTLILRTALHEKEFKKAQQIIESGLAKEIHINSELKMCIYKQNVDAVEFLLTHGEGDVNSPFYDEQPPLIYSLVNLHIPTLKVILKHNPTLNVVSNIGDSPLIHPILSILTENRDLAEDLKAAQLLLDAGCTDLVVGKKPYDTLVALLDNLAPISKNSSLNLPTTMAKAAIFDLFREHALKQKSLNQQLIARIDEGDAEAVADVLSRGADVNHRIDEYDKTPLGCDSNTPLLRAILTGDVPTVRVILEHKPKLDVLSGDGNSPICHAVVHLKKDNEKLARKMIRVLANAGCRNITGQHLRYSVLEKFLDDFRPACNTCFKEETAIRKLLQCSQCKTTYYCSRECQTQDWPEHKDECKKS
ncbi:MAG: zinc finger MYND domain-containing protein [Candidatus Babeliales bacterium]